MIFLAIVCLAQTPSSIESILNMAPFDVGHGLPRVRYRKNTVHVAGLPPHSVKPSAWTAIKILLLVGL